MKQKFNPALQKYEPELTSIKKGKIPSNKNFYKVIGIIIFILAIAAGLYFLLRFY